MIILIHNHFLRKGVASYSCRRRLTHYNELEKSKSQQLSILIVQLFPHSVLIWIIWDEAAKSVQLYSSVCFNEQVGEIIVRLIVCSFSWLIFRWLLCWCCRAELWYLASVFSCHGAPNFMDEWAIWLLCMASILRVANNILHAAMPLALALN